jgi:hypothetical protein
MRSTLESNQIQHHWIDLDGYIKELHVKFIEIKLG